MQQLLLKCFVVFFLLSTASPFSKPASAQVLADRSTPAAAIKVGEPAPDFSLPGSDGKTHHLAEIRGARNIVLVIFRGMW